MEFTITVQIAGEDVLAGHLYQSVRHGDETASFSYAASYLDNPQAFSLAPDMPLGPGSFHSTGLRELRAFEDCMPDRWGRNLMLRTERSRAREGRRTPRTLFEADMLAGVNDESRQGAIRIWDSEGEVLSSVADGVPRETSIPKLLDASDRAMRDMDADK
ncbi:HipA N-terminal domain-containing protein [Collinsella tanakaei]|uniref:HipA N-terminal domain-containing protein n=1 Tax=Collinsella tanakaei TaxID=626935 RepID=UPI0025A37748|nr:HipA N-terminal domain-containing protein [Collinsella tanakaei]MDM8245705.1 HipA N-terminal domain-containing protein [Collinsella tanakaei]